MYKFYFAFFASVSLLISCKKEINSSIANSSFSTLDEVPSAAVSSAQGKTFYGPTVAMSHGFARTFVKKNPQGKPIDVGVELSEHALMGLQEDTMQTMDMQSDGHDNVFELPFDPAALAGLPFNHVSINWEKMGHPPFGVYDIPHFDVHFYLISPTSQHMIMDDIVYAGPNMNPFEVIAPDFVPEEFFPGPFVAEMGTHWISKFAPEFNGGRFSETFIYGSHKNQLIFFEPMVSLETFSGKRYIRKNLPQPRNYPQAGKYYAQNYTIYFNNSNKTHVVQLDNFLMR